MLAPAPETAAKRPHIAAKAMCTALCGTDPSISCSGSVCSAADRNCAAGVQGNVKCDGVKTKCPTPCPPPDCDARAADCSAFCDLCPITQFQCDPYICHCDFNPNCV